MKWTRCIVPLLAVCLLTAACGAQQPQEPQPGQFVFTRENFPRLDGSTSTVPLGQAIASVLLGESREEVSDLVQFSKTTQSYRNLMWGNADLLIAAEPAETIWEEKEAQGFDWEMAPFAVDGLVFLVNADNPVDSLTTEQIQKIYTGEITNWSELGGADAEIAVFGREAGSGTRGAFEEIVGVEDACKYTNEYSSTGDVIGNVASNPNGIGYASLSAVDDTVKAVAVNGVTPSEDTVKDGSYEIQRPFVMVTKEGTQLSEAAQAFLDFAMSADAAEIIAVAGAVSANA